MKTFTIKKSNGTSRQIYAPSRKEHRKYRELLPLLNSTERKAANEKGTKTIAHGFVPGRSPVTCALPHVGPWKVTITCDISSWFDSIKSEQIKHGLLLGGMSEDTADDVLKIITIDGAPRQGLPTSPVAANLAAVKLDEAMLIMLPSFGSVYTRYADDLTISLTDDHLVLEIVACIKYIVKCMGWSLSTHKTHIQFASAGRRRIVGLSVGPTDIRVPRETRRLLRALRKKKGENHPEVLGLKEWCKVDRPSRKIMGVLCSEERIASQRKESSRGICLVSNRRILIDPSH